MLLGTLGKSLLGNLLTGKGIYRAGKVKGINKAGEGIVRTGYGRPSSSASQNNKMVFNIASSFNKLWTTKILWKWTKIW